MLDNILNLVKEHVGDIISQNSDVPEEKKGQAVEATTHAIKSGLLDNISGLTGLFTGNGDSSIINKVENVVSNTLTSKVGLSAVTASSIASSVVPTIINAISGKIQDPNDKGFNLESVIGALTGGKDGGLLNKIEGFFGIGK